ncbi:MAG: circadian clock KaiB family protein [Pseudanabaenales cyanobacterium]|nr:circadian clock KaiB family protein [Pseudanabaenales cyanobacterium]
MNHATVNHPKSTPPQIFKGIALFTPGGDLAYCIDIHKQARWHLHLCAALQENLGLLEPPHFLVPCYTATIDRWVDPQSQQVRTSAEVYPLVLRHQALLNAIFELGDLVWQPISQYLESCSPMVLASYREQFSQLWENHDLVIQVKKAEPQLQSFSVGQSYLSWAPTAPSPDTSGYVLRLFVSGHSAATERILQNLHQILEQFLHQPYTLKVIDVYKHPDQAEISQISATPTLVKVWPKPVRRIVGDLDDASMILRVLVDVAI